jgi:hypothetical protein
VLGAISAADRCDGTSERAEELLVEGAVLLLLPPPPLLLLLLLLLESTCVRRQAAVLLLLHNITSWTARLADRIAGATILSAPCGLRLQLCCSCFMQDTSNDRSAGLLLLSVTCCRLVGSSTTGAFLPLADCANAAKVSSAARMILQASFSPVLSSPGAVEASQLWRTAASREGRLAVGLLKMGGNVEQLEDGVCAVGS